MNCTTVYTHTPRSAIHINTQPWPPSPSQFVLRFACFAFRTTDAKMCFNIIINLCFLRRRNEKLELIFSQPPRVSGGLVCVSGSAERSSRSDSSANVKEGRREQKRFNGSDSCTTSLPGRNHAVLWMHRNLRHASCSTATVGEGCIKVWCVKRISSSALLRK